MMDHSKNSLTRWFGCFNIVDPSQPIEILTTAATDLDLQHDERDDERVSPPHPSGLDSQFMSRGLCLELPLTERRWPSEEQAGDHDEPRDETDAIRQIRTQASQDADQGPEPSGLAAGDPSRPDGPPLVCHELAPEQALSVDSTQVMLSATPILDLSLTFRLSSRPTASKTIYLDFNGHTTTGTAWNDATMGSSFYSPAYSFDGDQSVLSDAELTRIQQIWQRVAADFAPFDVNVTTLEPPSDWLVKSGDADPSYGIRAVITSYGPYSTSAGGIAMVGSFTANTDTPVYIYNSSIPAVSEATSHEVGHSLGLSHDGNSITGAVYYTGHGTGETSWAPIMGAGYNRNVTSWDDGTYSGSNNTGSTANVGKGADDMAVIVGNNGFSYQPDLVGNTPSTASSLSLAAGVVNQFGTIETRSDTDCYSFRLVDTGDINLSFDPYWYRVYVDGDGVWGGSDSTLLTRTSDINLSTAYPDNASSLDLAVDLYDSQGAWLYRADSSGLATNISLQGLAAGLYTLKLDGVGFGDPTASTPTGYTDYASIGHYMISGTITNAADSTPDPVITLAVSPDSVSEDGTINLVYSFTRSVVSANPLTVNFTVSGTAINGSDYSGLVTGSSQSVSFAANAATASVVIDPTADSTVEADETVSLMLALGTGYSLGTVDAVTGTISNDDFSPAPLVFTTRTDILTGTSGADSFQLQQFSDALWSSTPDRITNLQADLDTIDSPLNRTSAIKPKQLGMVKTLDALGIASLLMNKNFVKNGAATFTFNADSGLRSFLALNDATPGFKVNVDSVMEISGYSGNLSTLAIF